MAASLFAGKAAGEDFSKNGVQITTPKYLLVPLDETVKRLPPSDSSMPGHYVIAPAESSKGLTAGADISICNDSQRRNLADRVKALEQLNAALETKVKLLETTLAQKDGLK
ncbi:hypothetical protein N5J06_02010 [Ralstonia sp. CHL-2022]|uniref:Uncharacterized protein n=1 Tax=Ralstonia mojiangensis TaxID=2953895 RepID=A0ABT2L305_9RALS|nr:hypothetical protein [Ralstonia mojiangensis]MCT7309706.1 hypothetical protein [Ralstonia mojiangensis]